MHTAVFPFLLAQKPIILYDNFMNTFKTLWPGGPLYCGENFGTDALALASFAGERSFARACDLGCGSGILLLLLARERPRAEVQGLELRPAAAEQCRENIAANGYDSRCAVTVGDVTDCPLPGGSFDLVVTNPPYFLHRPSPDSDRATQRTESVPMEAWCAEAARLLKIGGDCCVVYPAPRLTDLLCNLRSGGLEPKELRFIAHRPDKAPSLLLCRARKGGKPGLTMRPTLYQTDSNGRETEEYRKICHWEA